MNIAAEFGCVFAGGGTDAGVVGSGACHVVFEVECGGATGEPVEEYGCLGIVQFEVTAASAEPGVA